MTDVPRPTPVIGADGYPLRPILRPPAAISLALEVLRLFFADLVQWNA